MQFPEKRKSKYRGTKKEAYDNADVAARRARLGAVDERSVRDSDHLRRLSPLVIRTIAVSPPRTIPRGTNERRFISWRVHDLAHDLAATDSFTYHCEYILLTHVLLNVNGCESTPSVVSHNK